MPHLLVWPLAQHLQIVFNSHGADLGTITCCDSLDMMLYHYDQPYLLKENITGCALSSLKQILQSIATKQQNTGRFADVMLLGKDQFDHVLVEMRDVSQKPLSYSVVSLEVIQSWAAQLDLLQVVMEENENEKKNRGSGCC